MTDTDPKDSDKAADTEVEAEAERSIPVDERVWPSAEYPLSVTHSHDPMTWRSELGRAWISITQGVFDIAEKTLVVAAFIAAAAITASWEARWMAMILATLLVPYIIFNVERLIARGFTFMRWHGLRAATFYFFVNGVVSLVLIFALGSGMLKLVAAIVQATT